jgi:hypothetical protein
MMISSIVRTVTATDGNAVLEVAGKPFFQLNPVGAAIWTKLSEGMSVEQIIHALSSQFVAPQEQIARDVNSFVTLLKRNLLVQDYFKTPDFRAELVWNKGIAARCNWRIPDEFPAGVGYLRVPDAVGHIVPPHLLSNLICDPEIYRSVKDGDIVWVRPAWLKSFTEQVLPLIKAKFILVTADSDASIPSQFLAEALEILEFPNVLHWYAQNCDGPGFLKRMSPLPIGVDFHTLSERPEWGEEVASPQQQEQLFHSVRRELRPLGERIRKVYVDFAWQPAHLYHPARRQKVLSAILANECFVFQSKALPRRQVWRKWGEYAFVLSPHGVGLDCHRTWEALACGNIVLVPSSPLDVLYEGLPVIPITDWNEVTHQSLAAWAERYAGCRFDEQRLTSDYWVNRMRATAAEKLGSAKSAKLKGSGADPS